MCRGVTMDERSVTSVDVPDELRVWLIECAKRHHLSVPRLILYRLIDIFHSLSPEEKDHLVYPAEGDEPGEPESPRKWPDLRGTTITHRAPRTRLSPEGKSALLDELVDNGRMFYRAEMGATKEFSNE